MEQLRRKHYGPITYGAWVSITIVIGTLAGFSLWSS